eukprot:SAG31_NODE_645_length_13244_cov_11.768903_9_plen_87_part_00
MIVMARPAAVELVNTRVAGLCPFCNITVHAWRISDKLMRTATKLLVTLSICTPIGVCFKASLISLYVAILVAPKTTARLTVAPTPS